MSRTIHHRNQKYQHRSHDYGARYRCNKHYRQSYGVIGRDKADIERRNESKKIIAQELEYINTSNTE